MTTIAWDGKTLAADSLLTTGNSVCMYRNKLSQVSGANGVGTIYLAAASGECSLCDAALRAIKETSIREVSDLKIDWAQMAILLVPREGDLICFEYNNQPLYIPRETKYVLGSGRDIARGAMAAGASAREAVSIAKEHDIYTGGKVNVLLWEGNGKVATHEGYLLKLKDSPHG